MGLWRDELILASNLCKTPFGRIVESLIEGRVSEGDLVAVQKAPEAGEWTMPGNRTFSYILTGFTMRWMR